MKFLFLCCRVGRQCELEYASCVARQAAKEIERMGHEVKVIDSPSPAQANYAIRRFRPDVVWWVGHGNPSVTTLEHVRVWIADARECGGGWGTVNLGVLSGKTACALSCLTASCLGRMLTGRHGCRYYLGYRREFFFLWCGCTRVWGCSCGRYNPYANIRSDVLRMCVTCMHDANIEFVRALARGMSPKDANSASIAKFRYWIVRLEKIKPKSGAEAAMINMAVRCLMWDASVQALLHEGRELPTERFGVIEVTSWPQGAEVEVDGKFAGRTPCAVPVKPGVHTVVVRMAGYATRRFRVQVKAGQIVRLAVRLRRTARRLAMLVPAIGVPMMIAGIEKER